MKPEFTTQGVDIQTFDEIFAELVAAYQGIYGTDVDLDANTPDGNRVGIEAKARADLQAFALAVYNSLDPDASAGIFLDALIKWAGIRRRTPTRSSVVVTITTDRNLTLTGDATGVAGYTVLDALNQEWYLPADAAVITGANAVTLYARNFGAVAAAPGTVTNPKTIVLGVLSVTNAGAAVPGIEEETDAELRIRRRRSVVSPVSSQIGALYTALANVPGVTDLAIAENITSSVDALGVPDHGIWVVVEGGLDADIAACMAKVKTGGCNMKGATVATWTETITKPDLTTFGHMHEMKFDRPTPTDLYVQLNVHRRDPAVPIDTSLIKAKIAAHAFAIGELAFAAGLYADAFAGGDTFIPSGLQISLTGGGGWTDGSLSPGFAGQFSITTAHITVTEI